MVAQPARAIVRVTSERLVCHRSLVCLDAIRFITAVYIASSSFNMFGMRTVNSLKCDRTSTLSPRANTFAWSLRALEPMPAQTPAPREHARVLAELVAALRMQDTTLATGAVLQGLLRDVAPMIFRSATTAGSRRRRTLAAGAAMYRLPCAVGGGSEARRSPAARSSLGVSHGQRKRDAVECRLTCCRPLYS